MHILVREHLNSVNDLIEKSTSIALLTHNDPDGDAIGSLSALHLALNKINKKSTPIICGTFSKNFYFLPLPLFELTPKSNHSYDLAITLDCGDYNRIGHKEVILDNRSIDIINIDHHIQDEGFGLVNIVDKNVTSSSELVYYLIKALGVELDKDISSLILAGIMSDTGNFMHSNTTPDALMIASDLVSQGANIKSISDKALRRKKISTLKLWGRVLSRIKTDRKKGIVSSVITNYDLEVCGATKDDLEGVVNLIASIPESRASLLLREDNDGNVRGSLRSNTDEFDVRRVASIFGGGGHLRASGFRIKGRIKETPQGWEIEEA